MQAWQAQPLDQKVGGGLEVGRSADERGQDNCQGHRQANAEQDLRPPRTNPAANWPGRIEGERVRLDRIGAPDQFLEMRRLWPHAIDDRIVILGAIAGLGHLPKLSRRPTLRSR